VVATPTPPPTAVLLMHQGRRKSTVFFREDALIELATLSRQKSHHAILEGLHRSSRESQGNSWPCKGKKNSYRSRVEGVVCALKENVYEGKKIMA